MAAEADGDEEGYEQWKYSIYLVAFSGTAGYPKTKDQVVPVAEMIKHLVPEARVIAHQIFHDDAALYPPDLDAENEDRPIGEQEGRESEGENIQAAATGAIAHRPDPDEANKRAKFDGLDVDARSVAVKAIDASALENEDTSEDPVLVTSVATHLFSPAWIEEEALALLEMIQKNAPTEKTANRNKVLLAGYGFGGIVVKKVLAVIIANTAPKYYNVALNISSLAFFATPHRSNNRLGWGIVLLDMIKATRTSHRGRLSHVLSRLADSVSQLSYVFYRFAAKYPTTNFIECKGLSDDRPVVGELGKFNNVIEKVVSWPDKDFNGLTFCAVHDLDNLKSLRTHFAPAHLLNQGISEHLNGTPQVAIDASYLEALQLLSPSRWIIYENRTLDKPDDFSELKELYRSLLSGIAGEDAFVKGSIQVTGPAGYGKSTVVKFLSQEMRQRSSVVTIENFLSSSEIPPPTLYAVYVSFLHQIISQRPSLFLLVQTLMVEILRQETWTEESPWILLAAVFHRSRAVHFLIVIYNFEDWPSEVRSWWSKTLGSLVMSCGSTLTFLTTSHHLINNLTSVPPHELDLMKEHGRQKKNFIRAKTNNQLDHDHGSLVSGKGLSDNVKKKIMSAAGNFQGPFAAINSYVTLLFQTFTLNNLDAIESDIDQSPRTEKRFYELAIDELQAKPPRVRLWASLVVSWILWSVRPLRIEELGAIVAVCLHDSSVTGFRPKVSMDMERDLRSHLGLLVEIENRYAHMFSPLVRGIMSDDGTRKRLDLQNSSNLTRLCLHYITLILKDEKPETWEKCLSQVSWKHQVPNPPDPALEFLYYACRFWPTHFLDTKLDNNLENTVLNFLLAPKIGERWFQLYLLCISQSTDTLIGDQEASGPAKDISEPELTVPGEASLVGHKAKSSSSCKAPDARQLAVHMASYVGLDSIIPKILGTSVPAKDFKMINVRRGYSEGTVAVSDTGSRYYLDCVISNDDDSVVKELLISDPARTISYFPLHEAARAGCLKTAQTIFNLLENPAQIDQDGRTPLHLAAIGGSTKMIRLLLGKDVSDTHPRRMDVPSMIDIKDGNSQTPLIIASRMGNIEATKVLIESSADLTIRDDAGKTALHYAVLNCPEAVGDFVARDLAHFCDCDHTPLHTAASSGSVLTTSILMSALSTSPSLVTAANARDDQEKTPLHYAAENGNTEVVEIFLGYKESIKFEDEDYQQAGGLAAVRGHLATVKLFISAAEKINRERLLEAASRAGQLLVVEYLLRNALASPDGDQALDSRPISLAASKGYDQVVRTLLRYNAAVNIEDATRQTPLHHAVENSRYHVAHTLLHHQANILALDTERNTPLHKAAMAGQVNVVELLLEHGADVEACSRTKETALHLAVKCPKVVVALLNANADRTATDMLGQTPLHKAAAGKCYESADLLRWDADMDAEDDDGRPPLYYAISVKDLTMVKVLSKDRPSLRDSQDQMHSALEWAVNFSALDVLRFLLDISSESVNKLNNYGRSIIHEAASTDSPEILTLLLKSGADVNLADSSSMTPLHDAASAGLVKNMQILIESRAEIDKADEDQQTPLHLAASSNSVEGVDILLKAKAVIDIRDNEQQTPLCLAAYGGSVQVVERLLEGEADVNLADDRGWSPLHAAADNLEITIMLLPHIKDINLQKEDSWTPLHLATYWSQTAVAEFLVENGANLDQMNSDFATALHLAVIHCNASLVQLMLDKGADLKMKDGDGLSCLSLAVGCESDESLKMLLAVDSSSASGRVWDSEDIAAAYWRAIEQHSLHSIDILVKKEGQLLEEVSNNGFTGLETCLRDRKFYGEEEPIAIRLLKLGANPFKRRGADHESAFELGIISRQRPKLEFMNACLDRVPEDFSSAGWDFGFKELRIIAELDEPDLWKKLEPLREAASAATDHDDWSLDHFIHQSADRVPAQSRDRAQLKLTKTATKLVARHMWLPPDMSIEALLEIAPSGLQVAFESGGGSGNSSPICLRADFPFPPRDLGPVYFEITILHAEHSPKSHLRSPIVTLGFCGEFCDMTKAHPGWNAWSVGYHGDDGRIFEEYQHSKFRTGCKFGPGNTVGCGIDYASEAYFFTLDGKIVARHLSPKIISRKLYPCVSHRAEACNVKVNFGEETFAWPGAKKQNGMGSDIPLKRISSSK